MCVFVFILYDAPVGLYVGDSRIFGVNETCFTGDFRFVHQQPNGWSPGARCWRRGHAHDLTHRSPVTQKHGTLRYVDIISPVPTHLLWLDVHHGSWLHRLEKSLRVWACGHLERGHVYSFHPMRKWHILSPLKSDCIQQMSRDTWRSGAGRRPTKSCSPDKQTLLLAQKHSHGAAGVQMSAWDSQPGPTWHGSFLRPHPAETGSLEGRETARLLPNRWSSLQRDANTSARSFFSFPLLHGEITHHCNRIVLLGVDALRARLFRRRSCQASLRYCPFTVISCIRM